MELGWMISRTARMSIARLHPQQEGQVLLGLIRLACVRSKGDAPWVVVSGLVMPKTSIGLKLPLPPPRTEALLSPAPKRGTAARRSMEQKQRVPGCASIVTQLEECHGLLGFSGPLISSLVAASSSDALAFCCVAGQLSHGPTDLHHAFAARRWPPQSPAPVRWSSGCWARSRRATPARSAMFTLLEARSPISWPLPGCALDQLALAATTAKPLRMLARRRWRRSRQQVGLVGHIVTMPILDAICFMACTVCPPRRPLPSLLYRWPWWPSGRSLFCVMDAPVSICSDFFPRRLCFTGGLA